MEFPIGSVVKLRGKRGTYTVKACQPGREHYDFFASDVDAQGREHGFHAVAEGASLLEHGPCLCGRSLASQESKDGHRQKHPSWR